MNSYSQLIQSLQNPALYPHKTESFKIIETHISWVLLTGSYAYKIKKTAESWFSRLFQSGKNANIIAMKSCV